MAIKEKFFCIYVPYIYAYWKSVLGLRMETINEVERWRAMDCMRWGARSGNFGLKAPSISSWKDPQKFIYKNFFKSSFKAL